MAETKACPACAEVVPRDEVFCRFCGHAFAEDPTSQREGKESPPTPDLPATTTCPACAEEVDAADPFCRFCGHDLRTDVVPPTTSPTLGAGKSLTVPYRVGRKVAPISARLVDPLARRRLAPWLVLLTGFLLIAGAVLPWVGDISVNTPVLGIINHHSAAITVGFAVIGIACLRLLRPSLPRLFYLLVLAGGIMGAWIGVEQFMITADSNRIAEQLGGPGGFTSGVGVYLLVMAGIVGVWAFATALRERTLLAMGVAENAPFDWRDRALAVVLIAIAIFLTSTAVSNSAESRRIVNAIIDDAETEEPAPAPAVNEEYETCLQDVTYWVDQVAAGYATLENVAFEYGVEDPRYRLIMAAYTSYYGLAFRIGAQEAAEQTYTEVVEPGCSAQFGGPL